MQTLRRIVMLTFSWIVFWLLLGCGGGTAQSASVGLPAQTQAQIAGALVPATYFGMHVHRPNAGGQYSWPTVRFGAYRSWDNSEGVCWPVIQRGGADSYDWSGLDKAVAKAQAEGKEFLYTLGPSPKQAWAVIDSGSYSKGGCVSGATANEPNHERWKQFVTELTERYCGCTANSHPTLRIKQYEIWNEPNLTEFFVPAAGTSTDGSVKAMVELSRIAYRTIKAIDSEAVVVSPSPTRSGGENKLGWLTQFLEAGGGKYADVIGTHTYCYPCTAEEMANRVALIRSLADKYAPGKPLWNTEAGWHSQEFTDDEAAAAVARAYLLNWSNGAGRFYFYAWDNFGWTSLLLTQGSMVDGKRDIQGIAPAGVAYDQVYGWMVGSNVSCGAWQSGIWKCELTRGGAYHAYVLWTTNDSQSLALPETWHVTQSRNLAGDRMPLAANATVQVGIKPVLYETGNP